MSFGSEQTLGIPWGRRGRQERRETAHGNLGVTVAPSRRHGTPSQDQALYRCGCGHRFEALVSTSVGCPRCGSTQAW